MPAIDPYVFAPPVRVRRSRHEWQRLLTAEQYQILRKGETERPFGWAYECYLQEGDGTYGCVGCGAELFSSGARLDSYAGWPAFYDVVEKGAVVRRRDPARRASRCEAVCAQCGGHLGHVYEGEGFDTPTDVRYRINRGALVFVPA